MQSSPRIAGWIAYDSNESGRYDIYVQPFPKGDGKWQISNNGGGEPRWRPDGKELLFLDPDGKMMSVSVTTDAATFEAGSAKLLFQPSVPLVAPNGGRMRYSVSADGQRFLLNMPSGQVIGNSIKVTLDWTAALHK
jgi:eukaryotic-like serine/threonine-protein kinase